MTGPERSHAAGAYAACWLGRAGYAVGMKAMRPACSAKTELGRCACGQRCIDGQPPLTRLTAPRLCQSLQLAYKGAPGIAIAEMSYFFREDDLAFKGQRQLVRSSGLRDACGRRYQAMSGGGGGGGREFRHEFRGIQPLDSEARELTLEIPEITWHTVSPARGEHRDERVLAGPWRFTVAL